MQSETSLLHQALYLWIQFIKVKYELQTATNLVGLISLKPQKTLIEKTSSLQRQQFLHSPIKVKHELHAEAEIIKDYMVENISLS